MTTFSNDRARVPRGQSGHSTFPRLMIHTIFAFPTIPHQKHWFVHMHLRSAFLLTTITLLLFSSHRARSMLVGCFGYRRLCCRFTSLIHPFSRHKSIWSPVVCRYQIGRPHGHGLEKACGVFVCQCHHLNFGMTCNHAYKQLLWAHI